MVRGHGGGRWPAASQPPIRVSPNVTRGGGRHRPRSARPIRPGRCSVQPVSDAPRPALTPQWRRRWSAVAAHRYRPRPSPRAGKAPESPPSARSLTNAMLAPSGDQLGSWSLAGVVGELPQVLPVGIDREDVEVPCGRSRPAVADGRRSASRRARTPGRHRCRPPGRHGRRGAAAVRGHHDRWSRRRTSTGRCPRTITFVPSGEYETSSTLASPVVRVRITCPLTPTICRLVLAGPVHADQRDLVRGDRIPGRAIHPDAPRRGGFANSGRAPAPLAAITRGTRVVSVSSR